MWDTTSISVHPRPPTWAVRFALVPLLIRASALTHKLKLNNTSLDYLLLLLLLYLCRLKLQWAIFWWLTKNIIVTCDESHMG